MIGILGPLALALSMAVPGSVPSDAKKLTSEYWVSPVGLYRIRVPDGWKLNQGNNRDVLEDVRVQPGDEPTVNVAILSRRADRPMTSIDNDMHIRGLLKKYNKQFKDVAIEKGPSRVPLGNSESWSYLLIYNTKANDGSKISVRETISYVNRRLNDRAYLHHIIIGRVPLPLAKKYSEHVSKFLDSVDFLPPIRSSEATPGTTGTANDADEGDDDDTAPKASAAPPAKPAAK